MYRVFGKRVFDVVVAGAACVVLAPVMLVVAVAIRFDDGGPIIFRQRRIGRDGEEFELLKFRSMRPGVGDRPSAEVTVVPVTRVGRVIRRLNVDELPQLMNILRGEMSVVGPRPALPAQRELLARRRESGASTCRPGLTGLAQVHAYDRMSIAEKAAWDARYAADVRLGCDLRILAATARYLLKPPPVY